MLVLFVAMGVGTGLLIVRNDLATETSRRVTGAPAPSQRSPSGAGTPTTNTPTTTLFCDAETATGIVQDIVPDASWTSVGCLGSHMVMTVSSPASPQVSLSAYLTQDRGGQWMLQAIAAGPDEFIYGDASQIPMEVTNIDFGSITVDDGA